VSLQTVGKYFVDDANTISVPAYTVVSAEIGIDRLMLGSGPLYCSAFAGMNNLFNKKYIGSAWLNPDIVGSQPVYIEPGLPGNFTASVSVGLNL